MTEVSHETRKTVTVVFTDVVGSTSLGERLDPETVRRVMSRYFDEARASLERHGGTVEKFIGDAVMAVFGIPTVHEDDAMRAVAAVNELRDRVATLNEELERMWDVSIALRTGINTGEVVAGDPSRGDALVTGDAVNVAARLEQAAGPGQILLGEETLRLVRDAVSTEQLPPLTVKGKEAPLRVFALRSILPGVAGRARRMEAPLVGRQPELERIREAFEEASRERRCRLLTIVGAPGEGKSRLVAEFLSEVERTANVMLGRCLSYGEGITFWPVAEIVRQVAGVGESDPPDEVARKIAKVAPEGPDAPRVVDGIAAMLGIGERAADTWEIFWSVRRLLEGLTVERPVVAVFEDLHWAEPTLLDLLEYLVDFGGDSPVFLIGTARPDLLEARPSWGTRPGERSIRLRPLDDAESDRLISGLLSDAGLPSEARRRIAETAEGNPLFVEEILRMLVDDGLVQRREAGWEVTGDLSSVVLPSTISALLTARLERLTADEGSVIGRASVVGTEFWWESIVHLSPEEERPIVGATLQALVRKELIRPARVATIGGDAFRFGHVLIRDAAYGAMPKATRADLHERFAEWVEHVAGDRPAEFDEIVGHHLEQAYRLRAELSPGRADPGLAAGAATRLAAAGRRALARGDMPAADRLLSRAIDLRPTEDPERLRPLLDLAEALYAEGLIHETDAVLRRCAEAAAASGDRALEARALVRRARVATSLGPTMTLQGHLTAIIPLVEELEALGDDLGASEGHIWVARTQMDLGQLTDADRSLDRALEHAERLGDHRMAILALQIRAWDLTDGPTPVPVAREALSEIMRQAAAYRSPSLEAWAGLSFAQVIAMAGDIEEARARIARGREIYEQLGMRVELAAQVSLRGAHVELLGGDPAAAERLLRPAVETLTAMGELGRMSSRAAALAEAVYQQGRFDEAWEVADVADRATTEDDIEPQFWVKGVRAKVLARRDDAAAAEATVLDALRQAEATEWLNRHGDVLSDMAEVYELVGRADDAARALEGALERYVRKGNVVSAARARSKLRTLETRTTGPGPAGSARP